MEPATAMMLAKLAKDQRVRKIVAAVIAAVLALIVAGVLFLFTILGGASVSQAIEEGCTETGETQTVSALSAGTWVNPLVGRLSSPYGGRVHPVTGVYKLHDGQDIAQTLGTPVHAAAAGTVHVESTAWAGPHMVTIDHGGGIQTVYGHMSAAVVRSGQQVQPGTVIGRVGSMGFSTGPHLHFTVLKKGVSTDPMPFMKSHGVQLGSSSTSSPGGATGATESTASATTAAASAAPVSGGLPSSWTGKASTGETVTLDQKQLGFAATVVAKGTQLGVSEDGIIIALMTPFPESGWKNYASRVYPETIPYAYPRSAIGSDHDSVGLYQQRPQSGWGAPRQLQNPSYAAAAFFGGPKGPNHGSPRGLLDIPGWESMSKGDAAQTVQVSAFPDRYRVWESAASNLLRTVQGKASFAETAGDMNAECLTTSGGASFKLASSNVLGASHTGPGGHHSWWASGAQRMPGTLDVYEQRGISVAGLQELQGSQWQVIKSRGAPTWGIYPQVRQKTENAVIWRNSEWSLVKGEHFNVPYFYGKPKAMSMVLLKQRSTGQSMWFLSIHNAADVRGNAARYRSAALRIELNLINRLKATGLPVFLMGDFNEVKNPHCTFVPTLQNAFGPGRMSPCRVPAGQNIDHIYGTGGIRFANTVSDPTLVRRHLADHRLIITDVLTNGGQSSTPAAAASSTRQAITFAMGQRGDAYVWGATGPYAWDCSSLMQAAWRTEGVELPRTSRAQSQVGELVDRNDLQPGDLIFYYQPVSHVAMYIGNGKIVHAARPGVGVVTAPLSQMERNITVIRRVTPTQITGGA